MAVSGLFGISLALTESKTIDFGSGNWQLDRTHAFTIENGTSTDQANALFTDTRSLTAASSETLDLAGGSLAGMYNALTFTSIKGLYIKASSGNTTPMIVTRPTNGVPIFEASGDRVTLGPGDVFYLTRRGTTGIPVTAGTGDLIDIGTTGAAAVTYDIAILGTT